MADTLESQLAVLAAVTERLTEAYQKDAERYRQDAERIQAEMAAMTQQAQQAQEAAFTTGLAEWDEDQLRGVRGWAKPDLKLVESLTPADLEALSPQQVAALGSHGKDYQNALNAAFSRAITEAQAAEQPASRNRTVAPQVAAKLEEMTADELYRAMNSGHGNTILQTLADMENA
jgi:hypothetical protein